MEAAQPILTLVPPGDKDKSKLKLLTAKAGSKGQPPNEPGKDSSDLIDSFDVERLDLETYLEAIYALSFMAHNVEVNHESILVLTSKAQDALKEMDSLFGEIIGRKEA
jgi:hypothetical protein